MVRWSGGWRRRDPGDPPFGLTPEMPAKLHTSRPWNPLIAQTLYRRGIIEIWGRGTARVVCHAK
ncbi:MAG: ATP-binding protein [Syntrophales bacterium]